MFLMVHALDHLQRTLTFPWCWLLIYVQSGKPMLYHVIYCLPHYTALYVLFSVTYNSELHNAIPFLTVDVKSYNVQIIFKQPM